MQTLHPPAIERHAERTLTEIATEAKEYLSKAREHEKEGAAYYRLVGERLIEAKAKLPAGEKWLEWLRNNMPVSPRQSQRYVALAQCDVNVALEDQWKTICGNGEKPEQQTLPTIQLPPAYVYCRPCRTEGRKPNCKACAALNKPVEASPPVERAPSLNGASPHPEPSREPGDDTEIETAAKQQEEIDLRKLKRATDVIWRWGKKIGVRFGMTVGKSYQDPETDPRFKPVIRKFGDAVQEMIRLYRQLEKESAG